MCLCVWESSEHSCDESQLCRMICLCLNELAHCMVGNFCMLFCCLKNTMRVSNSLDPDQVQPIFRSDLGPDCLQRFRVSPGVTSLCPLAGHIIVL